MGPADGLLQQVVDLFEIPVHHELDVMVPDQSLAGLSARVLAKADGLLAEVVAQQSNS